MKKIEKSTIKTFSPGIIRLISNSSMISNLNHFKPRREAIGEENIANMVPTVPFVVDSTKSSQKILFLIG